MLLRFSQFSPLYPPLYPHPLPSSIPPPLSSCPCLVHISSLHSVSYTISMPPTLFMPNFILLLPCTFAPLSPFPLPTEIPPCDVHFSDSVPVLVVCLVLVFFFFSFLFGSVVESCECVVISLFIILDRLQFLR